MKDPLNQICCQTFFLIIFEDFCSISSFLKLISHRQKKIRKISRILKFRFWKKKNSAPIPIQKLDLGFSSRYQNLVSVAHYLEHINVTFVWVSWSIESACTNDKYRKLVFDHNLISILVLTNNVQNINTSRPLKNHP